MKTQDNFLLWLIDFSKLWFGVGLGFFANVLFFIPNVIFCIIKGLLWIIFGLYFLFVRPIKLKFSKRYSKRKK